MLAITKKTTSRQAQSAEDAATTSVKPTSLKPTSLKPPNITHLTSDQCGATSRSAIVVVGTIWVAMATLSFIVSVALLARVV
jgi:hypothetical protein